MGLHRRYRREALLDGCSRVPALCDGLFPGATRVKADVFLPRQGVTLRTYIVAWGLTMTAVLLFLGWHLP